MLEKVWRGRWPPAQSARKLRPAELVTKMAVERGDPMKKGEFVVRLSLPADYKIPPHWHPTNEHVRVISGDFMVGMGDALDATKTMKLAAGVSPDSKWLIYRTAPGSVYSRDILAVPMQGERKMVPLVVSPATEQQPRLSPDGKWLSYQSNETGRFEIYVRPFPESGARVRVSTEAGTEPLWNRAGTALYYRDGLGQIVEVKVTTSAGFSIGAHRVVVSGDYLSDASHASYDVAPDGRFLLLKRAGAQAQTIVVHNWGRELREKTARRK